MFYNNNDFLESCRNNASDETLNLPDTDKRILSIRKIPDSIINNFL